MRSISKQHVCQLHGFLFPCIVYIYAYIFVCLVAATIEFQQLLHPFPRKLDLMFWQSFIKAPVSRQVEEELKLDPIEARLSTRPGLSERTLHGFLAKRVGCIP